VTRADRVGRVVRRAVRGWLGVQRVSTLRVGLPVLLLAALALAGCSEALRQETGVVIAVVSDSPASVTAFTLRTPDGDMIEFDAAEVDFGAGGFPAQHLREHQALAQPVLVTYHVLGGRNVATKLEDAPPG
jgi:hypothetical protein